MVKLSEKEQLKILNKKGVVSISSTESEDLKPKLVGGRDSGEKSIVVRVKKKLPKNEISKKDLIPSKINGILTDVQETDEIHFLSLSRTDKWVPAPGGVSCGHFNITAGTLGMWASRNGVWGILSNNHVLANVNKGKIGDSILQPGTYDGGTMSDEIAKLSIIIPIEITGDISKCPIAGGIVNALNFCAKIARRKTRIPNPVLRAAVNYVDCSWAEALDIKYIDTVILEIGIPEGEYEFKVGDEAEKSGRSSGLTSSQVSSTSAAINVNMGDGRIASFLDQVEFNTPGFIIPGDSGSIILLKSQKLVGALAFAGSDTLNYGNKYSRVKSALNLDTISSLRIL